MIKLDWKIYAIAIGVLLSGMMVLFLEKLFFYFLITFVTALLALVLRFINPLKYLGIELITLSTILVGIVYGPAVGGIYALSMLLAHLVIGDYYIGAYLIWLLPEYVLLGIISGVLGAGMVGALGVAFIIGMNLLNLLLTAMGESDRFGKELPFVIGNSVINSVVLTQFMNSVITFIG